MRKLRKAAVVIVVLGSVGLLGAGTANAHGGSRGGTNSFFGNGEGGGKGGRGDMFSVSQSTQCRSHDLNIDILGSVGLLNGVLGGALNGEGNAGAQETKLGSTMGCNNAAFEK
ncbi:hypothetical protein [Streptomyces violascens]|uniref:Uncharacterized protein n=1 Tax=Streptomyces violascens TaxID=67381 RepID=A0ABQ3QTR5_9ACTN|nr:hypothetical protein [Streptomyces violascens]GHI40671.1 hypothetical protein Sviol_50790 [Streptomyces violascens]